MSIADLIADESKLIEGATAAFEATANGADTLDLAGIKGALAAMAAAIGYEKTEEDTAKEAAMEEKLGADATKTKEEFIELVKAIAASRSA